MSAIAIIAEFDVKPKCRDAFERIIRSLAKNTLKDEDGCERCDVLIPHEDIGKIMLYEIYRDAEVLATHNGSPRLPRVREDYKDLIADKRVIVGDIV